MKSPKKNLFLVIFSDYLNIMSDNYFKRLLKGNLASIEQII